MRSYSLLGSKDFGTTSNPADKMIIATRIGKDLLRKFFSNFAGRIYKGNGIEHIDQLLYDWYTINWQPNPTHVPYLNKRHLLDQLQQANMSTTYHFMSAEALLHIFLWLQDNDANLPVAGPGQPPLQEMDDLFSFLMLFNDEIIDKMDHAKTTSNQNPDRLTPYREILTQSFPCNDIENAQVIELFIAQLDKCGRLLEYMQATPRYQRLHAKLLLDFGCATNVEYIQRIGSIMTPILQQLPGTTTIVIPLGANFQSDVDLFERLALQPPTAATVYDQDYLSLRARPVFRIVPGEYQIVNEAFLCNVLYNGLCFYASSLCRADRTLLGGNNNLLGEIRMDFSERKILYEMASSLFDQANDIRLDGPQLDLIHPQRALDYYTCRGNNAVLFESKDVYMTGPQKLSYDFDVYDTNLKLDGRIEKAALQLATNTIRVLNGELPLNPGVNGFTVNIYPVLFVHSPLYSCRAMNFWANYWFDQHLEIMKRVPGNENLNYNNVKPLTIVEADTLILYEQPFKLPAFDFLEQIRDYHRNVGIRLIPAREQQALIHAKQQISFADFIREKARQRQIVPNVQRIIGNLTRMGLP